MVRFKHRYLLVSLVFPNSLQNPLRRPSASGADDAAALPSPPVLSEGGIITLLRDSLSVNFGDVGAGELGGAFMIKYLSPHTHILIIRVSREHFRTLWAALTLLRRLGGHEVIARVLHVSGTIRKTQHAAIAHDRAGILADAKRGRGEAHAVGPAGGDKGPGERLKESEAVIMGLEA